MKLIRILSALLLVSLTAMVADEGQTDGLHDLKIGDAAPDFSLRGIDGKMHTLAEYSGAKILMIGFISNHCPDSHAAEGRIKQLLADMKGKSFAFVAINPNNPDGLNITELGWTKYSDGFEDMKKYAADSSFDFPYLYDGDTQAVAKAYGCLATPHIFIFDGERKLRYKGQYDDSHLPDPATVKSADARRAVEAMLAGLPVPVEVTKPHGCSTKWIAKKQGIAAQMERWDKTPVDVEPIDAAGVAALRKNGSKMVRLFNVWATWCGPCVAEFPELVKTARRFDLRDFEMITISADDPQDAGKAKTFLEQQGAGPSDRRAGSIKAQGRKTNSYIYSGADMAELMKGLDPDWPGAIPHTVLVAPNGEIIWRHNGPIDGEELRAKIVDYLGPFVGAR
jgi:peroxiredoxin